MGPRRQRLPDWQLDPVKLKLTQEVLDQAAKFNDGTIYVALSEPAAALRLRSPLGAATRTNLDRMVEVVLALLGKHRTPNVTTAG